MFTSISRMTTAGWEKLKAGEKKEYLQKHPFSKFHPVNKHHNLSSGSTQTKAKAQRHIKANPLMTASERKKFKDVTSQHEADTSKLYKAALRSLKESKGDAWYTTLQKAAKDKSHPHHHKAVFLAKNLKRMAHNAALKKLKEENSKVADLFEKQAAFSVMRDSGQKITKSNIDQLREDAYAEFGDKIKKGGTASVHPKTAKALNSILSKTKFKTTLNKYRGT